MKEVKKNRDYNGSLLYQSIMKDIEKEHDETGFIVFIVLISLILLMLCILFFIM